MKKIKKLKNCGQGRVKSWRVFFRIFIFLFALVSSSMTASAFVFLDGFTSGCSNGSTSYNPATRSCGSGSDTVYTSLATFNAGIVAGATNYMRAGNYYRTSGNAAGALDIAPTKAGTSGNSTIVMAYPGEERSVVIATAVDKFGYNPDPGSGYTSTGVLYYPNPAVSIRASYTVVDGIKTFGQVVLFDNVTGAYQTDKTIRNSDLGGGGPSENQGQVVKLHSGHNLIVENNDIHHSTKAMDGDYNGSAIIFYDASAKITRNTFHDNWGADITPKDSSFQATRTTEISYNFFKPGIAGWGGGTGVMGHNQDPEVTNLLVHNNIFYKKDNGILLVYTIPSEIYYNNTFIDNGTDQWTYVVGENYSWFNNIFYHSNGGKYTDIQANPLSTINANYNIYYSTTSTSWDNTYNSRATTLAGWKSYSGKDSASLSVNPNFINSAGTAPADFKRSSYADGFSGSPYSVTAGAYITGSEQIGHNWSAPSDTTPPSLSAPSSLGTLKNKTPNFSFTSNEAGTITYGGSCSSATTTATVGENVITLNVLNVGTYSNCEITVTDSSSNVSTPLTIPTFHITYPGDLDLNRNVNIFDYNILLTNFGQTNCGNSADIDGNCNVNIFDYNALIGDFGRSF